MKKLFLGVMTAVLMASCGYEKSVTVDHPVSAEFGQDMPEGAKMPVVCLDARGGAMTSAQIIEALEGASSSVAFVFCDAEIDGVPAGEWIEENCNEWGHDECCSADGCIGSSSVENAYFDVLDIASETMMLAEIGGYSFVIGQIQDSDVEELIDKTIQAGRSHDWLVLTPEKSNLLPEYTFTDCLAAQNGSMEQEEVQHPLYVYAFQEVWSRMSYVYESPLSFSVIVEQE